MRSCSSAAAIGRPSPSARIRRMRTGCRIRSGPGVRVGVGCGLFSFTIVRTLPTRARDVKPNLRAIRRIADGRPQDSAACRADAGEMRRRVQAWPEMTASVAASRRRSTSSASPTTALIVAIFFAIGGMGLHQQVVHVRRDHVGVLVEEAREEVGAPDLVDEHPAAAGSRTGRSRASRAPCRRGSRPAAASPLGAPARAPRSRPRGRRRRSRSCGRPRAGGRGAAPSRRR